MPYLKQDNRVELQGRGMKTPGEVNYCICRIINDYFLARGLCYDAINTVLATFDLLKTIYEIELLPGIGVTRIEVQGKKLEDPSLFMVIIECLNGHKSNTPAFDILGALNGAEFEIKRRIIAPYEDKKCLLNGEVFDSELLAQACRIPKENKQ